MHISLPNLTKLLSIFVLFALLLGLNTSRSLAASAFINPAQGKIEEKEFQVSVNVESSVSEPEMASASIQISYPASISPLEVKDGNFDSYLEKNIDTTQRIITIKAVNNADNYKSGRVALALIRFTAVQDTGTATLTIMTPQSEITGPTGQQLLVEKIDSTYTLAVVSDGTTPTVTPTTTAVGGTAPETGVNDTIRYTLISLAMLAGGLYLAKGVIKVRK